MKKFAVIGNPIEHSLSPKIHKLFAEEAGDKIEYIKLLSTKDNFTKDVHEFFTNQGIGINVTIPFKEYAYKISDDNDLSSIICNSANTLVEKNGKIKSYNTDGYGFLNDLKKKSVEINKKNILVIGAGGSAKSILAFIGNQNPLSLSILNRTIDKIPKLIEKIETKTKIDSYREGMEFDIVVNTTPISMLDKEILFPQNIFNKNSVSYDLFYAKNKTRFQIWSEKYGAKISFNGIGMLIEQAALSYQIWNTYLPDTKNIQKKIGF